MRPTRRAFIAGLGAMLLTARGGLRADDVAPTPDIVDMTKFQYPILSEDTPEQFHLTGDGYCYSSCGAEPTFSTNWFMKVYRRKEQNDGKRFILMKAPHKPCEYFIIEKERTGCVAPIDVGDIDGGYVRERNRDCETEEFETIYLETETMDWDGNNVIRDYHNDRGYPTFNWGRSNAVHGKINVQQAGCGLLSYCGQEGKTDEIQCGDAAIYIPKKYDLSLNAIDDINHDIGFDSVVPGVLSIVHDLGIADPRIMVIQNYMGRKHGRITDDPDDWLSLEKYFYLEGVGHIGWELWARSGDGPFIIQRKNMMTGVVWEKDPIWALEKCQDPTSEQRKTMAKYASGSVVAQPRYRYQNLLS